ESGPRHPATVSSSAPCQLLPEVGGDANHDADAEPDRVGRVGYRAEQIRVAGDEPDEHDYDRVPVQVHSRARVVTALHPHVAEQAIDDARHTPEHRAAGVQVLSEIRGDGHDKDEQPTPPRAPPRLNLSTQLV